MAEYETEEQQVEALKQWWAENGRAVLMGIGLGLVLIFGWRGWQGHQTKVAETASSAYTGVMQSLENKDDGETFLGKVESLKSEHGGSAYAAMASLAEARFHVEKEDLPAAEKALRWALDSGSFEEIKSIARLRLARVLSAQTKYDDALAMLDDVTGEAYAGMIDEIRGDIYLEKGDAAQALVAYKRARDSGARTASAQDLQMKLDDLAQPGDQATDDKS
jgi:predicted negative regulator of RcsB-dependent stress response